jgi:Protein of unknown function (DUF3500)
MSARELSPELPQRLLSHRDVGITRSTEPFSGIVTGEGPIEGLFPLGGPGAPTDALVKAGSDFLEGLGETLRAAASFPIDAPEWRTWCNVHPFMLRHGALIEAMDESQRELSFRLLGAALSERGYRTARDVMRLNDTLREITGSDLEYGELIYFVSVMGTPSATEPWGFQVDGHHLNINCFCLGDQLVVTPAFMGSEPVFAEAGKHAGTRVFADEEAEGLRLAQSLTTAQANRAVVPEPVPAEVFAVAFHDNLRMDYEGIAFSDLIPSQQEQLLAVISVYVDRIEPAHAKVKMQEVKAHLDETHFSWRGGREDDSAFYYRVHSPVVMIEFDHEPGVAFDNDDPSRNHIHTIVRTPNGNDYGKDLLRQHYLRDHVPAEGAGTPARG